MPPQGIYNRVNDANTGHQKFAKHHATLQHLQEGIQQRSVSRLQRARDVDNQLASIDFAKTISPMSNATLNHYSDKANSSKDQGI